MTWEQLRAATMRMSVPECIAHNATTAASVAVRGDDDIAVINRVIGLLRRSPAATRHDWDANMCKQVAIEYVAGLKWVRSGRRRYRLSDSLAALFRLTTAPRVDVDRFPHDSFLVEIPGDYLPTYSLDGVKAPTVFLLVAKLDNGANGPPGYEPLRGVVVRVINPDECSGLVLFGSFADETLAPKEVAGHRPDHRKADYRQMTRFVGNLVAFLADGVADGEAAGASRRASGVVMLRPPRDVVVCDELRRAARGAAESGSVAGVRRAMAHFVRGHWRNQPCGEGRQAIRRTWVKPHKRGDESLGRVVERITKVTGGES